MLRSLAKSSLANAGKYAFQIVSAALFFPFVLRKLGAETYGLWLLANTLSVGGWFSLLDLGMQSSLVKYVASLPEENRGRGVQELYSAALGFYLVIGAVVGTILIGTASTWFIPLFRVSVANRPMVTFMLWGVGLRSALEFPMLALAGVLEGFQRFPLLRASEVSGSVVFMVLSIVLLLAGLGGKGIVVGALAGTVTQLTLLGIFVKRMLPDLELTKLRCDSTARGALLSYALRVLALRVNGAIYNNMDRTILGATLGAVAVSAYEVAAKVHSLAVAAMSFTSSVVVPKASELQTNRDHEGLKRLLVSWSKHTLGVSLLWVTVAFIFAEPIISVWVGREWINVAGLTRLFLSYLFFWPLVQVGFNMLIGSGKAGSLLPIQTSGVILNLVLSVALVRWMGLSGVVLGTVIANAIITYPYLRLFLHTYDVSLTSFVCEAAKPPYLSAITAGAVAAVSQLLPYKESLFSIPFFVVATVITYGLVYWAVGLNAAERRSIRSVAAFAIGR